MILDFWCILVFILVWLFVLGLLCLVLCQDFPDVVYEVTGSLFFGLGFITEKFLFRYAVVWVSIGLDLLFFAFIGVWCVLGLRLV